MENPTRPRRAPRLASGGTIRDAAARLFLEKGYQGTSMDEIAAAARLSKQTIYTHFPSKEQLFADLVLGDTERVEKFSEDLIRAFRAADGLDDGLRRVARMYAAVVIRPDVLRLRRLVLAEAGRFPELARSYYERVPERMYAVLASLFKDLSDAGRLRVADPRRAAEHFAWLILGVPLDRGMFLPLAEGAGVEDRADEAVRVFLAAYGNTGRCSRCP